MQNMNVKIRPYFFCILLLRLVKGKNKHTHANYYVVKNRGISPSDMFFFLVDFFTIGISEEEFTLDTIFWQDQVRHYLNLINVSETQIRNVMDMNSFCGGFAVALNSWPVWVMNVVPMTMKNTLSAIYSRGLLGAFHDW